MSIRIIAKADRNSMAGMTSLAKNTVKVQHLLSLPFTSLEYQRLRHKRLVMTAFKEEYGESIHRPPDTPTTPG